MVDRILGHQVRPVGPNAQAVEKRATGFGGDKERPIEADDDGRDWALDGATDGLGSEDRATVIGDEERPIVADEERETLLVPSRYLVS